MSNEKGEGRMEKGEGKKEKNIAKRLISDFDVKLRPYFNNEKWKNDFDKKISNIEHDEPWLTLIAFYSIFGDQKCINNKNRIKAINQVFANSGVRNKLQLDEIIEIKLEEQFHEILAYRKELKDTFWEDNFHLYPDIRKTISLKCGKKDAGFEGNTNLDLKIIGKQNGEKKIIFIEAKFLSDISYKITYNPVRDQIVRNIDVGIDLVERDDMEKENKIDDFKDFYFMMLTPKIFRPAVFGDIKETSIEKFSPRNSRLYCYKMKEYLDYQNIKNCLPHRKLTEEDWFDISKNIGWITFEDFYKYSEENSTIDTSEKDLITTFFKERNLRL